MARRNKQDIDQSGGYVPASYQRTYKPGKGTMVNGVSRGSRRNGGSSPAEAFARGNGGYGEYVKPRSRAPRVIAIIVLVALIAAIGGLGFYIYKETQKAGMNEELHSSVSRSEMAAIDNELTGMTTFEEPFTVLLLGSDARADDPESGARTDTIVLVRVDPTVNIISMISIPRDTKVEIPGYGTNKFNAAYAFGGPSGTIVAVKDLTGVDIDHYAEINFEGLVDLIDAIGGIDVHVDEEINDIDAGDIVIPAGDQHLDGAASLVFSRSRAYADGDFTRVSNQRRVIEAIVHKGLEAPAGDLYGIVQASVAFLTTDSALDVDFIYSLADQIRHNNDYPVTIYSATLPSTVADIDGVSYVIADTPEVQKMVRAFLAGEDITKFDENISVLASGAEDPMVVAEEGALAGGEGVDGAAVPVQEQVPEPAPAESVVDAGAVDEVYYDESDYAEEEVYYDDEYYYDESYDDGGDEEIYYDEEEDEY